MTQKDKRYILNLDAGGTKIVNFGLFVSEFLKYFITLLIIVAVAAVGFIVGRIIRKSVDKKKASEELNEKGAGEDA